MIQTKPCKAQNKAKGYENACGKDVDVKFRKFGLCPTCFWDWMHTDENGKIYYRKQFLPMTKVVSERNRKKLITERKIEIMSPDKYRAKYVQPLINKIARLIDVGHPCIATGNYEGKMAGGHYTSVGSNRTISLNLHNIFIQSFQSNSWSGGDDKKYQQKLIDTFGKDYFEFVNSLKGHRPIKLTKDDLEEIKMKAKAIIKKLENFNSIRTNKERIIARNGVNRKLGIYDLEYSIYKIN